nr:MAG TPA: terminase large subunit [Caudoviricetes sp.]
MANYENIKGQNDKRTPSERQELARIAGKASGISRRKKANFKKTLLALLPLKTNSQEWKNLLEDLEVDDTYENALNAAIIKKALDGDVRAYEIIRNTIGQEGKTDIDDKVNRAKIEYLKAQAEHLKTQTENMRKDNNLDNEQLIKYKGLPATVIAPAFASVVFDIHEHAHTEYVFPGGRGSAKSSFVSLQIIDLIMSDDNIHAVVMRQVADTLRGSVYQQIIWAIDVLDLNDDFHCTVSPMEITRKATNQKIYFRGADDPGKLKSIKVPFGYIGLLWFEELDQFIGAESVRKIEQSVIRGGDTAYIFKSFNPPKTASNWANKYIKVPKETRLITESNYTQVPAKWLGKPFIDEAEFLKETNPDAYENEYLGVANGSGGNVFDNVSIREITNEEIGQFDHILNGVDWGWYPDPYAFLRVHYEPAQHRLYVFQEYTCNKQSNRQTADKLIELGITGNDLITCDSAEEKSVGDYRAYGLFARVAEKGPGSREYSYKWLQSLREIIIDNIRCPKAAQEFLDYEYERDKEGNVISGYPDGNDHCIDAVRYATNRIWRKKGQ